MTNERNAKRLTSLPSALRGTARHIRECRDGNGNNPYWKLGADADDIELAADEIDALRQRAEAAEREADLRTRQVEATYLVQMRLDDRIRKLEAALSRIANDGIRCNRGHCEIAAEALANRSESGGQNGEVVVTTNDAGECDAVTRQDEKGEILSVIWERDQSAEVCPDGYLCQHPNHGLCAGHRCRRYRDASLANQSNDEAQLEEDEALEHALACASYEGMTDATEKMIRQAFHQRTKVPDAIRALPDMWGKVTDGMSEDAATAHRICANALRNAIRRQDKQEGA